MGTFIDLTGLKINRWDVIKRVPSQDNIAWWHCVCECGNTSIVKSADLRYNKSKSCGCLSREVASDYMKTHGKSKTKTYKIWKGMKRRCNNLNNKAYPGYGGRGVSVCERWESSYEEFLKDMGECPDGYSIERMDVNGSYKQGNCIWIPLKDQARNKRKQVSNTSGYTGVYFVKGRNSWVAMINNKDGLKKTKHFSIKKYGDSAKILANGWRESQIEILRESGVYYGEFHGK